MAEVKQILTGYVVKEGSQVKSWKKRWFVFSTNGNMSYYTNRQETSKKGEVDMRQALRVIKDNTKKLLIEITFDSSRVLRLKFDEEAVEDRWYNAFLEFIDDQKTLSSGFSRYDVISSSSFNIGKVFIQTEKGSIQSAVFKKNNKPFALKTLFKNSLNQTEIDYIQSIHKNLRDVTCPYVMKTLATFDEDNLFFVMNEYPTQRVGDIMDHAIIPLPKIKFFATELLLAINAIHHCQYTHMEINPETVYLTSEGHVLLSAPIGLRVSYKCGYNYFAPEILEKKELGFGVDYWSLGILLFAMCFGDAPFYDTAPAMICKKIISEQINFPYNSFPEVESFIAELLVKDAAKRNCDFEILKTRPFFAGTNFDKFQNKEVVPQ
ncbi:serine/threonine protein kinase, putative [Entamoeba invadens IP1]|uniref:non-specific serine/threonine protein kinase n=1 Tax=Entamoeba invadens IP1 TaxID=370355 RepID=A0A0A1U212_ENTIV|nr:serine/threonine protein kinase, putative [Entamoeba invadens IP1]ELP88044.1 serine/threonine protein kinase, putative [Entamoeba invadens IP1]|eukprot:XP_004254815.1 serine/threonine protein kinase, putative [Entamoeba invadens IP1]